MSYVCNSPNLAPHHGRWALSRNDVLWPRPGDGLISFKSKAGAVAYARSNAYEGCGWVGKLCVVKPEALVDTDAISDLIDNAVEQALDGVGDTLDASDVASYDPNSREFEALRLEICAALRRAAVFDPNVFVVHQVEAVE